MLQQNIDTTTLAQIPMVNIKNSIGMRLITIVFSIYFLITLSVTVTHMSMEYLRAEDELVAGLHELERLFASGLANALWNVNEDDLSSILRGMLGSPIITGISVRDSNDTVVNVGEVPATASSQEQVKNENAAISKSILEGGGLSHQFKAVFDDEGEKTEVGVVTIYSSRGIVLQKVQFGFLFIIFNSMIKTFSLWIVFLLVSRKVLTLPLNQLISAVTKINLDNVQNQKIDIHTRGENELKTLETAFNTMLHQLHLGKMTMDQVISDLKVLNTTGRELQRIFDQTKALEVILDIFREKIHVERGSVYLLDDDDNLNLKAYYPLNDELSSSMETFRLGEGAAGKAAAKKETIFIKDTSQSPDFIQGEQENPRSLLCIPLMDDDKLLGVVNLSGELGVVTFDELEKEFTQTLTHLAVATVNNIQMVNLIEEHNRTLEQKVIERTSAIKDLLDNTGQGFFTFNRDYKVHKEYSKACEVFFEKRIEGLSALELLFEKDDNVDVTSTKELFDMIFNDPDNINVFEDLLPAQITFQARILSLEYLLLQSPEREDKFMVILTDVTKEQELASQIAAEEERNAMIIKVALDREGFLQFIRELKKLFDRVYTLLNSTVDENDMNELFRCYHTIKGGAASYGLKKVSEQAHTIESRLENIKKEAKTLSPDTSAQLNESTQLAEQILTTALSELSGLISEEDLQETEQTYKIRDSKIIEFREFLIKKIGKENWKQFQTALHDLCKQPIGPVLDKYAMTVEGLAERLNKAVQVKVLGKKVEIAYEQLNPLLNALVHLVRNCVDHGLEESAERVMLGKPEEGTITIEATAEENMFSLIITDDGQGIDAEVIKNAALKKGIINESYAETAAPEELVKLILAPGFSTKEEVSDISGRGVGMDAINIEVERLKGAIQINTEIGQGTTFKISVPEAV